MLFFESISVAIVAFVFVNVLMEPGMIFGGWYGILQRINERAEWLAKPLGYCGTCFSGQLSFWWYLIEHRVDWTLFDHIVFVSQTIFIFMIINKWAQKNELT